MNYMIRAAKFITLAIAHFVYVQENQIKLDPEPLDKPDLSQFNTDHSQLLPELRDQAYVGSQQFDQRRSDMKRSPSDHRHAVW